jgi:hypothetical protein
MYEQVERELDVVKVQSERGRPKKQQRSGKKKRGQSKAAKV